MGVCLEATYVKVKLIHLVSFLKGMLDTEGKEKYLGDDRHREGETDADIHIIHSQERQVERIYK